MRFNHLMRRAALALPLLLAGSLFLGSCSSIGNTSKKTTIMTGQNQTNNSQGTTPLASAEMAKALTGDWAVVEANGRTVNLDELNSSEAPYLSFAARGTDPASLLCCAFNGCNFTNLNIVLNGANVSREGQPASTLKLCPDAQYEMAMASALTAMASLEIAPQPDGTTLLYVKNASGKTVMTLRRNSLNFLDGAWQAVKIGGGNVPSDLKIQVVIDLAAGTIHGNGGCNVINGRIEPDMATQGDVKIGDIAASRMTCPNIEMERAFIGALEQTKSVESASNGNKALFKDREGKTLLEMKRLSRTELEVE